MHFSTYPNQLLQQLSPGLDAFFYALTWGGEPLFWVLVSAYLFWRGKEKESFFAMTTLLVAGALVGAAKNAFRLERPSSDLVRVLAAESSYGFPSGHSTLAAAEGVTLSKFTGRKVDALLAALAIGVMASRVYLGVHFLEDVLVGAALGVAVGWLATNVFDKYEERLASKGLGLKRLGALLAALVLAYAFMQYLKGFEGEAYLLGAIAGYYAGLMAHNDSWKKARATRPQALLGLAALGAWALFAQGLAVEAAMVSGALGGLFITLLYPYALYCLERKRK